MSGFSRKAVRDKAAIAPLTAPSLRVKDLTMGISMNKISKQSLTDIAYAKIKQKIITGRLKLGQQIVESDLAASFNISKTPIHEALLKLKSEGLVNIFPRSGTFVFSFTVEDLHNLANTRIILEQGALRLAYKSNSTKLLAALSQNIAESFDILQDNKLNDYLEMDRKFHESFFFYAQNQYLTNAYSGIFSKISALRHRLCFTREFIEISLNSHLRIYNSLMDEKIDESYVLLERHIIGAFTEEYLKSLSGEKSTLNNTTCS